MADKNYLHTAYANSADGTDRFTTVYPNLNLLKGTKTPKSITGKNTANQIDLLYIFDNNNSLANQGLKINDTLTLEFDWSATNPASGYFVLQWQASPWSLNMPTIELSSTNSSGHVIYTFNIRDIDIDSTAVATALGYRFDFVPTNTVITLENVIIRKTKISQPWMPSSSEVTTADWPKFVGTYVDTNPVSSTVSSNYDWDEIKYRVYLDGTPVGGSKLLSFNLENLKADTTYNVQINQINGNIESDKSESVAFKTTLTK
ncbi:fibronectin type III domain-containing protein [Lactococcus cremoris]|uniref:fibronectin type III domain-containing protein n=1 Tax=Lactococcus lactis subsp. cremoris TaxID=1359 RepID=UPI002181F82F|nr:fibronectin type III domain-containing protein [Lactococcus cremoris]MCT0478059.1 fibronectin type III domain-containing protein [Lactococcus cremoris]